MSRFTEELRVIPRTAWVIATLSYACLAAVLLVVAVPHDLKMSHWPVVCQLLFGLGVPISLFLYVLLIGYINGDARRRGMRYVLWTFLAILIPNSIGIILYFVLRDPCLTPCRVCGAPGRINHAFCTKCGAPMSAACQVCKKAVEPGWANCPYCGAKTAPENKAS